MNSPIEHSELVNCPIFGPAFSYLVSIGAIIIVNYHGHQSYAVNQHLGRTLSSLIFKNVYTDAEDVTSQPVSFSGSTPQSQFITNSMSALLSVGLSASSLPLKGAIDFLQDRIHTLMATMGNIASDPFYTLANVAQYCGMAGFSPSNQSDDLVKMAAVLLHIFAGIHREALETSIRRMSADGIISRGQVTAPRRNHDWIPARAVTIAVTANHLMMPQEKPPVIREDCTRDHILAQQLADEERILVQRLAAEDHALAQRLAAEDHATQEAIASALMTPVSPAVSVISASAPVHVPMHVPMHVCAQVPAQLSVQPMPLVDNHQYARTERWEYPEYSNYSDYPDNDEWQEVDETTSEQQGQQRSHYPQQPRQNQRGQQNQRPQQNQRIQQEQCPQQFQRNKQNQHLQQNQRGQQQRPQQSNQQSNQQNQRCPQQNQRTPQRGPYSCPEPDSNQTREREHQLASYVTMVRAIRGMRGNVDPIFRSSVADINRYLNYLSDELDVPHVSSVEELMSIISRLLDTSPNRRTHMTLLEEAFRYKELTRYTAWYNTAWNQTERSLSSLIR